MRRMLAGHFFKKKTACSDADSQSSASSSTHLSSSSSASDEEASCGSPTSSQARRYSGTHLQQSHNNQERRYSELAGRTACNGPDASVVQIVPRKLYFSIHADNTVTNQAMRNHREFFFFTFSLPACPNPAASDVDLSSVFCFWRHVETTKSDPARRGRPLAFYFNADATSLSNNIFLLATYLVLEHENVVEEVMSVLEEACAGIPMPLRNLSERSSDNCRLSLRDCVGAVTRAVDLGWFDVETFNVNEYDRLKFSGGGGISQVGDQFFAFPCPNSITLPSAIKPLSASFYANTLMAKGVTAVVRLNEPESYEAQEFVERGIAHYDVFFEDGSVPSPETVRTFFEICDKHEQGMVGVHCQAGLGRTGTLISLWLMRYGGFSAPEAMAWIRLVRPGSVMGKQQTFLLRCEEEGFGDNTLGPTDTSACEIAAHSESEHKKAAAKIFADDCKWRAQQLLSIDS